MESISECARTEAASAGRQLAVILLARGVIGTDVFPQNSLALRRFSKVFPNHMKTAPEEISGGRSILVALERFCSNTMWQTGSDHPPLAGENRPVTPSPKYRRITGRLRAAVVESYGSGQTSRQVAEELALGRTTVLKILKTAGVTVRLQGHRY